MGWEKLSLRTVKCDDCGERRFYIFADADTGSRQLREKDGKTVHVHGKPATNEVTAPAQVEALDAARKAGAGVIAEPNVDAIIAGLIPDAGKAATYLPRRINGRTDVEHMLTAIENGQNVLLLGPKGCGKNHLLEATFAKARRGLIVASSSAGSTVEDAIGQYVLTTEGMRFVDGSLLFCAKYGLGYGQDEVNALPRDVAFAHYQILDYRRQIVVVQKGATEIVRAHEDFAYIGTMNPGYAGTKPLNPAFASRFGLKFPLDYNADVERRLIKDRRLLDLADDIRKAYKNGTLTETVSTRELLDHQINVSLHGEETARESFLSNWQLNDSRSDDVIVVRTAYEARMAQPKNIDLNDVRLED